MPEQTSSRLNIVVVMTDDHGAWAAGCYGNSEIATPNLDYMARSGCRALNAFTPNPVCSPARACFFTGRLPSQHGIHDWLSENSASPRAWLDGETNVAEILRQQGYRTGLVGKWHCGNSFQPQPGFDYWHGYARGQYPHFGQQQFVENGRLVSYHGRQAPYLTSKAAEFIRQGSSAQPFFLFLGLVDTHSPFTGHPERLVAHYRTCTFRDIPQESPSVADGWVRFGTPSDKDRRKEWLAQYYASVTLLDEQVGRLLDELESTGQLANTLVVYTSDHGHMNGHHGLYTKGNATVPQNLYDESIRVPFLARLPSHIPGGRTLVPSVDHCDLFRTVLDAAGAKAPDGKNYPGQSFWPMLQGHPIEWRDCQYCEYGNARMIRTEKWKFIKRYAPHDQLYGDELYALDADPRESTNLASSPAYSAIIHDLHAQLEAHFLKYEVAAKSGRNILALPAQNNWEPWRLARPDQCPPEGSEWRTLAGY
jgi:choline-sulfatase